MRAAAAEGAQPANVPLRVYGGYLEARAALKKNAPDSAANVLKWLIGYLAEERGVPAEAGLDKKLDKLFRDGVVSERIRDALFDRAMTSGNEQAWALMSIVEHALFRLYLQPRR
jgi:hypothetical protein